jgi:hypothetical protein
MGRLKRKIGLEFDRQGAEESAHWRWYIGDRRGNWKKSRRLAKKELGKEMIEPKSTKKDPDKVKVGSFTWGPDKFFDPEKNPNITKG